MKNLLVVVVLCAAFAKDAWSKNHGRKSSSHKIVGGTDTDIKQHPYQTYLLLQKGNSYYQCGGSIISNKAILTAAHCVQGIEKVYIRIGSSEANRGGREYSSSIFTSHPLFNSNTYDHDVAIIRLTTRMELDGVSAKAVTLPSSGEAIPSGTNATVTGWGTTSESGDVSYTLMGVTVPTLSNEECSKKLNGITDYMVCAGVPEGGKDSCQGDSGGPAVSEDNGHQIGIVSFGYGCARPNYPGVYTRVAAVRSWIRSIARV